MVVHGDRADLPAPGSLPVVVLWVGDEFGGDGPAAADAVVGPDDVDDALRAVASAPIAAASLVALLRTVCEVPVDEALALESATYSMLHAGVEFAAWRKSASHRADTSTEPTVSVDRIGDELRIVLDRPHRHNAISVRLRDELTAALAVAVVDSSIVTIDLSGSGPSFSSGGDLAEFGTRPDVAAAHVTRLARSPARLAHRLANRLTARVHGATFGGGIELAAFAGRVVAHPDTLIRLPEIELGLIPGAGGTVSLSHRIGRQRLAALALTGLTIDAVTARRWRLVDAIEPSAV